MFEIRTGDCIEVLRGMADSSVDSIVTDPPYGLSFMGKRWDYDVPDVAVWVECLRVIKPGGHLLAFAGTRTQHRMAVRIEDAGFEIRDMIAWVYGSGFPKSHNLDGDWKGWGTALKPALEPITVARKPIVGTVAANVLQHGTGAINVDGCRVEGVPPSVPQPQLGVRERVTYGFGTGRGRNGEMSQASGRWPANLVHDGSEEPEALLGSAARFFYCAKASKRDRDEGCEGLPIRQTVGGGGLGNPVSGAYGSEKSPGRNHHPTVKPTDLMRYLCRLVTPPGGLVLDPFAGSGSTGKGALLEGFRFLGIERDPEYVAIAQARCAAVQPGLPLA